jgi:hypothetical protein
MAFLIAIEHVAVKKQIVRTVEQTAISDFGVRQ